MASSDFLNSIFGSFSGGLSLFAANNPFRKKSLGSVEGIASTTTADPQRHSVEPNYTANAVTDSCSVEKERNKQQGEYDNQHQASVVNSSNSRPPVRFEGIDERSSFRKDASLLFPEKELAESRKRARITEINGDGKALEGGYHKNKNKKRKKEAYAEQEGIKSGESFSQQESQLQWSKDNKESDSRFSTEIQVGSTRSVAKLGKRRIEAQHSEKVHKQKRAQVQVPDAEKETKSETQFSSGAAYKRKNIDSIEERYEKRLRGLPPSENPKLPQAATSNWTPESKKRKGLGDDTGTTKNEGFDDEEKLKRTIFVGNLPLNIKQKALMREFSQYGPVESVRLRSVPLLDTKISRKGAVIKHKVNETINSQHAYIVFEDSKSATAALAHNMKELNGNHLRVDVAQLPCNASKGKSAVTYDRDRSIFVGNVPFDVKDEELYQLFGSIGVEAVRVVRDPQTSLSRGIAYVLFKTKESARQALASRRNFQLRERPLRVSHISTNQKVYKQFMPTKRMRTSGLEDGGLQKKQASDMEDTGLHKKRAKLSASYEGLRSSKEKSKEKRPLNKLTRTKIKTHGGSSHFMVSGPRTQKQPTNRATETVAGQKRKRAEKQQRGASRSKKIRRS